jgi:hypothetical protein
LRRSDLPPVITGIKPMPFTENTVEEVSLTIFNIRYAFNHLEVDYAYAKS